VQSAVADHGLPPGVNVDSFARPVHVQWDAGAAMAPLGQEAGGERGGGTARRDRQDGGAFLALRSGQHLSWPSLASFS
jgi:hypothetical protein